MVAHCTLQQVHGGIRGSQIHISRATETGIRIFAGIKNEQIFTSNMYLFQRLQVKSTGGSNYKAIHL